VTGPYYPHKAERHSEFNNTYLKALHLRRELRSEFAKTFRIPHPASSSSTPSTDQNGVDVILQPTAIRTAPTLGEKKEAGQSGYLQDLLTVPASLAGLPSMSVPSGKGRDGWPVGVSLVGQWGMEEILFWAGSEIEKWTRHSDHQ